MRFLYETKSITEHTQRWWSVRPHLAFPTVEVRICDAQPDLGDAQSLTALIYALAARFARAIDEGEALLNLPGHLIEENMWRAIRHGLDGDLLDLERAEPYPASEAVDRLLSWSAPVRGELGIDIALPSLNGAQRQRRMTDAGMSLLEAFATVVAETRDTYAASTAEVTR